MFTFISHNARANRKVSIDPYLCIHDFLNLLWCPLSFGSPIQHSSQASFLLAETSACVNPPEGAV